MEPVWSTFSTIKVLNFPEHPHKESLVSSQLILNVAWLLRACGGGLSHCHSLLHFFTSLLGGCWKSCYGLWLQGPGEESSTFGRHPSLCVWAKVPSIFCKGPFGSHLIQPCHLVLLTVIFTIPSRWLPYSFILPLYLALVKYKQTFPF